VKPDHIGDTEQVADKNIFSFVNINTAVFPCRSWCFWLYSNRFQKFTCIVSLVLPGFFRKTILIIHKCILGLQPN